MEVQEQGRYDLRYIGKLMKTSSKSRTPCQSLHSQY